MEEIRKLDKNKTDNEFEKLLSQDMGNRKFKEGEITTGIISEIGKKYVFIDLGLKSESAIPIEEFKLTKEIDTLKARLQTMQGGSKRGRRRRRRSTRRR